MPEPQGVEVPSLGLSGGAYMPKRVEEVRLRMERVRLESDRPLASESASPRPRDSCEGVLGVGGSDEEGVRSKCLRGDGRSKEECSDMPRVYVMRLMACRRIEQRDGRAIELWW